MALRRPQKIIYKTKGVIDDKLNILDQGELSTYALDEGEKENQFQSHELEHDAMRSELGFHHFIEIEDCHDC